MGKINMDKIKENLEEVYDKAYEIGFSRGKVRAYKRVLQMIDEGKVKDLNEVKMACMVGINMEEDGGIDSTSQ